MFHELCIPVTMKAMALGHPLERARCLAAMIVLHLVLLCTLLGCRMVQPDETGWLEYRRVSPVAGRGTGIWGLIPAGTGTAGSSSRAFLQE
jgi:hypothetical protein